LPTPPRVKTGASILLWWPWLFFLSHRRESSDCRERQQTLIRRGTHGGQTPYTLFVWLINHQLTVIFSQDKPAISNQSAILFS
jgi:hypothetical protein